MEEHVEVCTPVINSWCCWCSVKNKRKIPPRMHSLKFNLLYFCRIRYQRRCLVPIQLSWHLQTAETYAWKGVNVIKSNVKVLVLWGQRLDRLPISHHGIIRFYIVTFSVFFIFWPDHIICATCYKCLSADESIVLTLRRKSDDNFIFWGNKELPSDSARQYQRIIIIILNMVK